MNIVQILGLSSTAALVVLLMAGCPTAGSDSTFVGSDGGSETSGRVADAGSETGAGNEADPANVDDSNNDGRASSTGDDGDDDTDVQNRSPTSPATELCGTRTVDGIPGEGFVMHTVVSTMTVDDEMSGLAMLLSGDPGCDGYAGFFTGFDQSPNPEIIQIDSSGIVRASFELEETDEGRFYIGRTESGKREFSTEGGCLNMVSTEQRDGDDPDPFDFDDESLLDSFGDELTRGPCEDGGLPIYGIGAASNGRRGRRSAGEEKFVCVAIDVDSYCVDCSETADGWVTEFEFTILFTAQSSVEDMQICDGVTVSIAEGDQVSVTIRRVEEYRPSSHPTDLGYVDRSSGVGSDPGNFPDLPDGFTIPEVPSQPRRRGR